ncbi:Regulator Of G-Protein Signaling 9 [Manis pentadactyla]|nr:Regulator Of G-Protein Signaling 9 [Manis pentadactyla]
MSHRGVGTGPSDAVAPRPSSLNAQGRVSRLHSYACTQHIRFRSVGTEPVLSWAHHVKPVAPFKCYGKKIRSLFTEDKPKLRSVELQKRRTQRASVRSSATAFALLCGFFKYTHTYLVNDTVLRGGRMHAEDTGVWDEACMYYLYDGILRFYVSMKQRQYERKDSRRAVCYTTYAVVPLCMLCKTKSIERSKR